MAHVEYCLGNVDAEARRQLRARGDTREASCLEHCGRCHAGAFLVVDGEVWEGTSHEALLAAVDGRTGEVHSRTGESEGVDGRTGESERA